MPLSVGGAGPFHCTGPDYLVTPVAALSSCLAADSSCRSILSVHYITSVIPNYIPVSFTPARFIAIGRASPAVYSIVPPERTIGIPIVVSSASLVAYSYPSVVAVDPASVFPATVVTVVPTNPHIVAPVVESVRSVPGIPYGVVEASVRTVVDQTEPYSWPHKEAVKWPVDIIPVIDIDETGVVLVYAKVVIEYTHTANSPDSAIAVPDIYIAYLRYPTIKVVVNGYVFYLDDSTVIVILDERVVIKTGVEGYTNRSYAYSGRHINPVIHVEVEFAIRIYGKCNPIMHENKGVIISISISDDITVFCGSSRSTHGTEKRGCN